MLNRGRKNPVEQRIDRVRELWNEFVDDDEPRLLRFKGDAETLRLVEAFIALEGEEAGECPDLFLRFEEPFEQQERYGFQLRAALEMRIDATKEEIAGEDFDAGWVCPEPRPGALDVDLFAASCTSLREHYADLMEHLAIALTPEVISDPKQWPVWLQRLLRSELPPEVRLLVLDDAADPLLDRLAEVEPLRMRTVEPQLETQRLPLELARKIRSTHPGHSFRLQYLAIDPAIASGNLGAARRAGEAALAVAVREQWLPMQVAAHMALSTAYTAFGKAKEARDGYRLARQAAIAAEEKGEPAGPKLVLQSRLAEASVLVGEEEYAEAAVLYEESAPSAEAQEDSMMLLECWRMASFCHESLEHDRRAWHCGWRALEAGEKLEEEERANSTLPYAGQGLLRLTERRLYRGQARKVRRRMVELMGEDWEPVA